jgi:hypothetical protein
MKRLGVALALLVSLLAAAPAAAAPNLETGIEDEALLLTRPNEAPPVVAQWKQMGIEVVRLHARWNVLAPAQRGGPYDWRELDRAVEILRAADLKIMLTITGPGPAWSSLKPGKGDPLWEPDPAAFGRFARDVASRYRLSVDRYIIWNEPNIPGWLMPQWDCKGRRCTLAAPHVYRRLVRAAVPAIRGVDPSAEILMGELAPIGESRGRSNATRIAPLPFLRAMACVDNRYKRIRGGRCRGFKPARADSFGYHPHGVKNAPDMVNRDRDEAQVADLPRLFKVLDRLSGMKRLLPARTRRFDVHLTEFGYQTSPPDHAVGITLAQQVRYLQQTAYIAWRHARIRSLVHYQWFDEPVHYRGPANLAYAGWQSGLMLVNGIPKPSYHAFPHPFVIDRAPRARSARFWGQVRPGGTHVVTLQRRARGSNQWTAVAAIPTDVRGFFSRTMPVDSTAEYRFSWRHPNPTPYMAEEQFSGIVAPGAKLPRRLKASTAP